MVMKIKNTCAEFPDFIIVHAGNFTKNDLLSTYFAQILTRRTEKLFRKILLDDYKISNSLSH